MPAFSVERLRRLLHSPGNAPLAHSCFRLTPTSPNLPYPQQEDDAHRRSLTICGARFWCKWAYKPGSVLTAIYLDLTLPPSSSYLLGNGRAGHVFPPRYCSRIEFTGLSCSQSAGELLPRLSTLTRPGQLRYRRCAVGIKKVDIAMASSWRYISVALVLKSPSAGVTRYPCPMEPGLSSRWAVGPLRAAVQPACVTILPKVEQIVKWRVVSFL